MYKIFYATGSRADYGIVRNYLQRLEEDENIDLSLLVTGAHLEKKFGFTKNEILKDGHNIIYEVPLGLEYNSDVTISVAKTIEKFGHFFSNNKPDLLIILGDRYEMLGVAIAAALNKIKILHIHGGEATFGNYDEFIRHSISKMSTYHIVSTEKYRSRVIQLGEGPDTVFNLGSLGAENCKFINLDNVESKIKDLSKEEYFVVLFHPETLSNVLPEQQIKILLKAIERFSDKKFVFIGSNADTGSDKIRKAIKEFIVNNENCRYFENLSSDGYHYLVQNAICLLGNSSSGLIEAPSLGTYTINIGDRQKGREMGNSVINVKCNENDIYDAMQSLNNNKTSLEIVNPYETSQTSYKYYEKTLNILVKNKKDTIKSFYDL